MRCSCLLASVAVGLTLAACGDDDEGRVDVSGGTDTAATSSTGISTEQAAPTGGSVATIKVSETEFALTPGGASVAKPGVVRFEVSNDGKIDHALEVEGPKGEVETERIAPGEKATLRADLNKVGRYTWYCPIGDHADRGMKGAVTVALREGSEGEEGPGSDAHGGY